MKFPRAMTSLQDRLATLLGCEPSARAGVIDGMLYRSPREVTGYWLQLVVSTGIATFGLVLGSTAVVIGAMLVAPLMGPILSLGMGLAVGSPFLVVRGAVRVVASAVVVVGLSAGVTRLLPFHELNAEIAARTTPTALDLGTAVFCAVAGVYAAMRPASDVATTAAGTSIGISLVPPLCVSGYGIGTSDWVVAMGALLLFVTNFVAIVLVGTLAFATAGFGKVDVATLERESDKEVGSSLSAAVARRLSNLFRSRGGPWLRILMPMALLAAVYTPLRRGLDEVAWQVGSRAEVEAAIADLPRRVVESRIRVERRQVEVVIFLLGAQTDARDARDRLTERIARTTQSTPRVEVFAVPDATEFEALERSLRKPTAPVAAAPTAAPSPPAEAIVEAQKVVENALATRWPTESAGAPQLVEVSARQGALVLHVIHLGASLGPVARETLERVIEEELGTNVLLVDTPIPTEDMSPQPGDWQALSRVASAVAAARRTGSVSVCITTPAPQPKVRKKPAGPIDDSAREFILALIDGHPRSFVEEGEALRVRFVEGECQAPGTSGPNGHR